MEEESRDVDAASLARKLRYRSTLRRVRRPQSASYLDGAAEPKAECG